MATNKNPLGRPAPELFLGITTGRWCCVRARMHSAGEITPYGPLEWVDGPFVGLRGKVWKISYVPGVADDYFVETVYGTLGDFWRAAFAQ